MLHPDSFYHIYNHANGSENLFRESKNYYFFLDRAKVDLLPYMKLYAYCLMPNHFHFLVRIKSESEIKAIFAGVESFHQLKASEKDRYLSKKISKSISNLCSSYTQSINKVYQRKGSLFMPNFKSNEIRHENDFCKVVHYIHANPVHHRFVSEIDQWKSSSFHSFLSDRETALERAYVIEVFGGEKFSGIIMSNLFPRKMCGMMPKLLESLELSKSNLTPEGSCWSGDQQRHKILIKD